MSWLEGVGADHPFGLHNLPYGSAVLPGAARVRLVCRIGEWVLDLASAGSALLPELADELAQPTLNGLLARGPQYWSLLRRSLIEWLSDQRHRAVIEPLMVPLSEVELRLPFEVADYVDFYASEHHAANLGRILRPNAPQLPDAWKHLPIGYHGRAGTVVVSGTDVVRPSGLRRGTDGAVEFGPTRHLDFEAEVGFIVGNPTRLGQRVPLERAGEHLFGVCIVNDWSARDIQAFEYVPLGPFLGKSFATSLSPWIVPMAALDSARLAPPSRSEPLAHYLDDASLERFGLDLEITIALNGTTISNPPFASMYWTPAQMLAHLTVNGASLRAGDLLASGTVSGAAPGQAGSLIELTSNGSSPLLLPDGSRQAFLEDGDDVVISARVAVTPDRAELSFGEVAGRILPAPD